MSHHPIRVAVAGVGNCASSLIQGVHFYAGADPAATVPGLMHVVFGDYHVSDIEFVAAFDVDAAKVGADLCEAIGAGQNNTLVFATVPPTGVTVQRGPTLDGLGSYYREVVQESAEAPVDVVQALKDAQVDVLVSYLPVGSEEADRCYAQAALEAGVAFVNNIPVFIASDEKWAQRFREAGVPIIGDDIKAQVGATIVHRVLADLFAKRGVRLDRTYQLNTGGNTDFLNMANHKRLEKKKISKTEAVQAVVGQRLDWENIHVGPSDYVPWQNDNKVAFIRLEGTQFGGVPMHMEVRLSVEDSPNSAGVASDMIRCAKLARDRGLSGPIDGPAAFFCKHPPRQMTDDAAHAEVEAFIRDA